MDDDDDQMLADWLTACEELAAAKQKTKELHALVQERRLGPYAPDAAVCHVEPEDVVTVSRADAERAGLVTEGEQR